MSEEHPIQLTSSYRMKRAKRIRRAILVGRVLLPVLLLFLCFLLFRWGNGYKKELPVLEQRISELEQKLTASLAATAPAETPSGTENVPADPSGETGNGQIGEQTDGNGNGTSMDSNRYLSNNGEDQEGENAEEDLVNVYLTFDDGPSGRTDTILDILELNHIKATFFVVGKPEAQYDLVYQRILEEGHTLGMHSYSHDYGKIYASEEAFTADLDKLTAFLYDKTGVESRFYRFPGGSSNTVSRTSMYTFFKVLRDRDILYFDWNVDSYDSRTDVISADTIVNNIMRGYAKCEGLKDVIILMHDSDDKRSTVEALPKVIEKLQATGNVRFMPITEETPLIQHKALDE